jgi:hypothetical protein
MCSAQTDAELRDWLRWGAEHGPNIVRALAHAVSIADLRTYVLLRPVLVDLKSRFPQKDQVRHAYGRANENHFVKPR